MHMLTDPYYARQELLQILYMNGIDLWAVSDKKAKALAGAIEDFCAEKDGVIFPSINHVSQTGDRDETETIAQKQTFSRVFGF